MLLCLSVHLLCLSALSPFLQAQELKSTRWPLYSQKPLLLVWNSPTVDCMPRHQVDFQFNLFQIVSYPTEGFVRQNLTIFYKERLGLYPYYSDDGTPKNGGLPQLASLEEHFKRLPDGLDRYIKEPKAKGLAVIDWEEWRPLWLRNWKHKDIYREKSRQLVRDKNPGWTEDQVKKVAQQEFEYSARRFMQQTLRMVKSLRPEQLWGFYLFPDCYNHGYINSNGMNYTGRCPEVEMSRNDELQWLWTESKALFPSVYLVPELKDQKIGRQFVRNRVREGMRLASTGNGTARPVFIYTRPTYINNLTLLTEMDLVYTIGESVSLGAAGVILWGDATYASSRNSCLSLSDYLRVGALGHYLLNVSSAAEQCSAQLCSWHGRCLRRRPDTNTYLHLSPRTHTIELQGRQLVVRGQMDSGELEQLNQDFECQCYTGYKGAGCTQSVSGNGVTSTKRCVLGEVVIMLVLTLGFLH